MIPASFLIPVRYDHIHRQENLKIILSYLASHFKGCEIIVLEQGGNVMEEICNAIRFKNFTYICYMDTRFHRTKYLNYMASLSKGGVIINYDCDVIVPLWQLNTAIEQVNEGYDFVLPYTKFMNIPRKKFLPILQKSDWQFSELPLTGYPGLTALDIEHVGGCVVYAKKTFWDCGGENENFISYGPEDAERLYRFKTLRKRVARIEGVLYHIEHYRGSNSSVHHSDFKANQLEYHRVRNMDYEQLSKYINTWSWRK